MRGVVFAVRQAPTYEPDTVLVPCLTYRKVRGRIEPRQDLNGAVFSDPDITASAKEMLMQRDVWSGVHRTDPPPFFERHFVRKRGQEELRDPIAMIDPFYHLAPHLRADSKRRTFDLSCSLKFNQEIKRATAEIIVASPFTAEIPLLVLRADPDSVSGFLKGQDFLKYRSEPRN